MVLASERDGPHGALDDVVVDFDPPVVEISGQARPARERVADRLGEGRFAGDGGELAPEPRLHRIEDRLGPGLADGLPRRSAEAPDIALDGVEGADARERLRRDWRRGRGLDFR